MHESYDVHGHQRGLMGGRNYVPGKGPAVFCIAVQEQCHRQIEHSRNLRTYTHSCLPHITASSPPIRANTSPHHCGYPCRPHRRPRTTAAALPPSHRHRPANTGRAGAVHPHGGRTPAGDEAERCCCLRQGHVRIDRTGVGCRRGYTGGCGTPRGMAVTRGSQLCARWQEYT